MRNDYHNGVSLVVAGTEARSRPALPSRGDWSNGRTVLAAKADEPAAEAAFLVLVALDADAD